MVDGFMQSAEKPQGMDTPAVIISPHAGFVFSGPTAARSFKAAQGALVRTVVILGPSHYFSFKGAAVWKQGAFLTPLGEVKVDTDLAETLISQDPDLFQFRKDIFEKEHSIETQLPFIQRVFPEAMIVPVIMGQPDPGTSKALAEAIFKVLKDRDDVLVDVSSDLSHFHTQEDARRIDKRGLDAIVAMDLEKFWQGHVTGSMEVDAFHAVAAAMLYARAKGLLKPRILGYATSADATGDTARVVGYGAVAFEKAAHPAPHSGAGALPSSEVLPLNDGHKKRLLAIARQTLDEFVRTGKILQFEESDPRLSVEEGAFVTLHSAGALRGCIGQIIGRGPLWKTVRDMAVAAASEDPRFAPVRPSELKDIDLEISVLSRPVRVKSPDEIVMGSHGVIVRRGTRSGVFLPQVATETGWGRERFLSELCSQKAGLLPDAWQDPSTILEIFSAQVFGSKNDH